MNTYYKNWIAFGEHSRKSLKSLEIPGNPRESLEPLIKNKGNHGGQKTIRIAQRGHKLKNGTDKLTERRRLVKRTYVYVFSTQKYCKGSQEYAKF